MLHISSADQIQAINEFLQKYACSTSDVARTYVEKAAELLERIVEAEQARIDWANAICANTILGYSKFLSLHPNSEHQEEASSRICEMKEDLLNEMIRWPQKFHRDEMADYINLGILTREDLVDKNKILTDNAYHHIKRFPTISLEQRGLPILRLENPVSPEGNIDVLPFGVCGSGGKTCLLASLMALTGSNDFFVTPFNDGAEYISQMNHYLNSSTIPPATAECYMQVMQTQLKILASNIANLSFIEFAGEKVIQMAALNPNDDWEDLGSGLNGILCNNNKKILLFPIDFTITKGFNFGYSEDYQLVYQPDILSCVISIMKRNKQFCKNIIAIHMVVTKVDTLGDNHTEDIIQAKMEEQGYITIYNELCDLCKLYGIMKHLNYKTDILPFSIGQFMPGLTYKFDNKYALDLLNVLRDDIKRYYENKKWYKL